VKTGPISGLISNRSERRSLPARGLSVPQTDILLQTTSPQSCPPAGGRPGIPGIGDKPISSPAERQTYAYTCSDARPGGDHLEQEQFNLHIGSAWSLARVFTDKYSDSSKEWPDRPAGRQLFAAVRPGDTVVIACLSEVAGTMAEGEAVVNLVLARGVELHIVNGTGFRGWYVGPVVITRKLGLTVLAALRLFRDVRREDRRRAARAGIAAARAAGRRFTNYPGYGFRWAGPKGRERLVPDEYEQAVIRHIVDLRRAGASWHEIAAHLMHHRVVTASGQEWSVARVRRAFASWTARSTKIGTAPKA